MKVRVTHPSFWQTFLYYRYRVNKGASAASSAGPGGQGNRGSPPTHSEAQAGAGQPGGLPASGVLRALHSQPPGQDRGERGGYKDPPRRPWERRPALPSPFPPPDRKAAGQADPVRPQEPAPLSAPSSAVSTLT